MPAEPLARKSLDCALDTTQLLSPKRKSTDRQHDKNLKATDALTLSPTSTAAPNSTPEASPVSKPAEPCPQFTDETVILQHGSESDAKAICIRKELLDNLTRLWRGETEQRIILPKTHATVLDMFIDFLNGQSDPLPYIPSHSSAEPWRSHAVDAWLFSYALKSLKFDRFALSHFINGCALLDSSVFLRIENDTNAKSSLCRFSKHWVAWNHSFAPNGKGEYAHLAAARLASVVTKDTNDPRIYDIAHWYSPCGDDINSSCLHDPVVRENAVQALFASRRPVPEEGLQWERDNQPGRSKKAPTLVVTSDEKKASTPTASIIPPPPPYKPFGPSKSLQASTAAQALLSSASTLPRPPKSTAPLKPLPNPRLKLKASILSKSTNAALRNSTLTSAAGTEATVPVPTSPVVERTRNSILAPAPPPPPRPRNSESYLALLNRAQHPSSNASAEPDKTFPVWPSGRGILASSPSQPRNSLAPSNQPQAPNNTSHTTPLKQISPMARFLLASDIAPPPKTPAQLNASLRRAKSGVPVPNQK